MQNLIETEKSLCSDPSPGCCTPMPSVGLPAIIDETYPTREQSVSAWEKLTAEIAEAEYERSSNPPAEWPEKPGSLTILGSGIESIGFSRDAEAVIKAADKVFYCVADTATIMWLRKLRPDAYDLYVFYEDCKVRFKTYTQMTESILHPVRKGENVVAIYYGHPGVFVLSTHRAVEIAKREGHYARMKAGISALDCLCADLGVDPAHPGMLTFEATDMLVRRREPDPRLHVILWQVGLIGQMGYRRKGFVNDKFQILIEYLQSFYGKDYPVTHYVAARYPTLEPTADVLKLSELSDPAIQQKITGLSTFYLAPRDETPSDSEMAARLGLCRPGQKVGPAPASRPIGLYGPRELAAIDEFKDFKVPSRYQDLALTRSGEFLIRLADDPEFAELYRLNPEKAVSEEIFPGLTDKEKKALIRRKEGPIQIAVKGGRVSHAESDLLVVALLNSGKFSREFQRAVRKGREEDRLAEAFTEWTQTHNFDVRPREIPSAVKGISATMLLPWTAAYYDEQQGNMIGILGHASSGKALVFFNDQRLKKLAYHNAALSWHEDDGNPHSGLIRFDLNAPRKGPRAISGTIKSDDLGEIDFNGVELNLPDLESPLAEPASTFEGNYQCAGLNWDTCVITKIRLSTDVLDLGHLKVNDFTFENGKLTWVEPQLGDLAYGKLQFLYDPISKARYFFGAIGPRHNMELKKSNICGYTYLDKLPPQPKPNELDISDSAWYGLLALSKESLRNRLVPFWSEWQKNRLTSQIVHRTLLITAKTLIKRNSINSNHIQKIKL